MKKFDYIIEVRNGRDEIGDKRFRETGSTLEEVIDRIRKRYPGRKIRVRDESNADLFADLDFNG